ncbi:hypothetical protein PR048_008419 [Dryococelus australis]|uniref:Uncharacterized protein n=1 Tax=Dryococelus australis TaxID=614101 RepID=A0ABQ9HXY3_9NEOP|nr:hypothetical protein PR048_008419 [Dryococelus australis]
MHHACITTTSLSNIATAESAVNAKSYLMMRICVVIGDPASNTRYHRPNDAHTHAAWHRRPQRSRNESASRSGEIWAALKEPGKREILEKTRRPATSSGTIPTCENPEGDLGESVDHGQQGQLQKLAVCRYLDPHVWYPGRAVRVACQTAIRRRAGAALHHSSTMIAYSLSEPSQPAVLVFVSKAILAALHIEVLRADEGEASARNESLEETGDPEETRRPVASSGTIPTCENPGEIFPGIGPGSPRWEVSSLTTTPPWLLVR